MSHKILTIVVVPTNLDHVRVMSLTCLLSVSSQYKVSRVQNSTCVPTMRRTTCCYHINLAPLYAKFSRKWCTHSLFRKKQFEKDLGTLSPVAVAYCRNFEQHLLFWVIANRRKYNVYMYTNQLAECMNWVF